MSGIIEKEFFRELRKLSFFSQHSGLFDGFAPQTRKSLEALPIEWESVQTDGETNLKWQAEAHWKYADLEGKLNDKSLQMRIKKTSSRNTYTVSYDNKKYTVESMNELNALIESLEQNKMPRAQMKQMAFDVINKKKTNLHSQAKQHYLNQVSDKNWVIKVQKDPSRIYVKFFVQAETDEEKEQIKEKLKEHDNFRMDSVGSYIKKILKSDGVDVSDLEVTRRVIDMPRKTGFVITIK